MRRKVISLAVILCVALGMVALFDAPVSYAKMTVVDANNRECPVMGKAISVKKFNTIYDGKRYWFSSYDAVKMFKDNPKKYASKLRSYSTPASAKTTKKSGNSLW